MRGKSLSLLLALALLCSALVSVPPQSLAPVASAQSSTIRFAQFNASLNRSNAGDLITDLTAADNAQAQAVAEIIQRINPDVLLINEFDYDENGQAAQLFQQNYLGVSQNGAAPVTYPHVYQAPSNTGIPSGLDFDNNGSPTDANDAFGFGFFPGQFGMLLLSKYPFDTENIRTFQNFLWKDMPNALLPDDPATPGTPADWYSSEELDVFRLSSKSHWDVPVQVNGRIIHALVSHPTPPVFDGAEDRNGTRNHDEIRFWADYVTPGAGAYIYDDDGGSGGLPAGASFVIMGDQNADPFDGDSTQNAILQLLDNPNINTRVTPGAPGGREQAALTGQANLTHQGNPIFDTADFADGTPGNLRADYVLPSLDLAIADAGIFWPLAGDPLFSLVGTFPFPSSDHRLVYVDVSAAASPDPDRRLVTSVDFLGEVTFATGTTFDATEIGGLSGITYDAENEVYYLLADDRSQINPARFYTATIDVADNSLDDGDIVFTGATLLQTDGITPTVFPELSLDPEGIVLTGQGTLLISSEGDANAEPPINPFIKEFSIDGTELISLPVSTKFAPGENTGIRNNLAFESMSITPDGNTLYSATENALAQDGPPADVDQASLARVLEYDLRTGLATKEIVYPVDPVADPPVPADQFRTNGLVELLPLDNNGTLLALERSFSVGVGNVVKLYEARTQGALDVIGENDLFWEAENIPFEIDPPIVKEEILNFSTVVSTVDNLEGMTFGPDLADGRKLLIVVSDNNFNATQFTQFIALAVTLETIPAALPAIETAGYVDDAAAERAGDLDDPAIWPHPSDPSQSLVITTLKDGGLAVFDLNAERLQLIAPEPYGAFRYNNVDLIYNFQLGADLVDLAVVSDRQGDTLAVFRIDPATRRLTDVTSPDIIAGIFGGEPGEATAYGLASFTSTISGKAYVFVCQADGNLVSQLELRATENGQVTAREVRRLELPIPAGGEAEDSQAEGMVVDRELGYFYIAVEEEIGVLKYNAEPTGGTTGTLIHPIDAEFFSPDIEGLTIYYGADGAGYLLISSQGDSTYAVFSRSGDNAYLGSFVVGDNGRIDQANETDGADVLNVPLGPNYPNGLLVVQDGADDPQQVFEDDEELENRATNFKFVPWENVANAFDTPLLIDPTSYDPRSIESLLYLPIVASE